MPRLKLGPSRVSIVTNGLSVVTVLLLMAFASGCSPKPLILPEAKPEGGKAPTLEEMLDLIRRREESIKSFKATATIVWTKGTVSEGVGAKILYRKPKQLRLETLGPMGLTTMTLVTDEKGFTMYFPAYNLAIKDEIGNLRLKELLETEIDITLDDILSSATGGVDLDRVEVDRSTISSQNGFLVVDLSAEDGSRQRIWTDREFKITSTKEVFDARGHLKARMVFSDPYAVDGITLHRRIEIIKPENGSTVSINYKRLSLNPALDEEAFSLSMPPGVAIYGWEAWSSPGQK
jgi:outer membrane lipoprotein-sorting protein